MRTARAWAPPAACRCIEVPGCGHAPALNVPGHLEPIEALCAPPARESRRADNRARSFNSETSFMALSLYDISVPVFVRGLGQLPHVLDKGLAQLRRPSGTRPGRLVQRAPRRPTCLTLGRPGPERQRRLESFGQRPGIAGITAPSFPDTETELRRAGESAGREDDRIPQRRRPCGHRSAPRRARSTAQGQRTQVHGRALLAAVRRLVNSSST